MATNNRNEREARRNLQKYLRQLSYFDSDIPTVPIDGIKGDDTTDAIRAYQRKRGLEVSGVADLETWEALYEDYLLSLEENSPPLRPDIFPTDPVGYKLYEGDENFTVSVLQYILGKLSILFPLEEVEITGRYGKETTEAVRRFQERYLLPVTGVTDKLTWNALVRVFDSLHLYE